MRRFETVVVPENGRYTETLESGDALENTLIDITADGARFSIRAEGNGWSIRNLGIRGVWDCQDDESPIITKVEDGGTALVENVFFADGAVPGSLVTGIYVPDTHAGELGIDSVNIQDLTHTAIHASSPGLSDGYGNPGDDGKVHVTDSYVAGCKRDHFALGTDSSYVDNSVSVGGDRGLIGKGARIRAVGSDFSGSHTADIVVDGDARIDMENCRYETSARLSGDEWSPAGDSPGDVVTTPPESVPLTPEEAAGGDA